MSSRVKHPDEVCKAIETIMTFMVQESDQIPSDLSMCLLSSVKKNGNVIFILYDLTSSSYTYF